MFLTVDSPFFPTIVLFNHRIRFLGFRRFSRKIRIPGFRMGKVALDKKVFFVVYPLVFLYQRSLGTARFPSMSTRMLLSRDPLDF